MTDLRTAAQQAMDILNSEFTTVNGEFCRWCDGRLSAKHNCKLEQVITALRAALELPVEEPFALPCPTPKACKAHCCSGHCVPRTIHQTT